MSECIDCGGSCRPDRCPDCGACDFGSAGCWNCGTQRTESPTATVLGLAPSPCQACEIEAGRIKSNVWTAHTCERAGQAEVRS